MNNTSIHQPNLDIIALETKHQKDFERCLCWGTQSLKQQEFSKNYQEERDISFADGNYDGELDLEPEPTRYAGSPMPKATSKRRERSMVQPNI